MPARDTRSKANYFIIYTIYSNLGSRDAPKSSTMECLVIAYYLITTISISTYSNFYVPRPALDPLCSTLDKYRILTVRK